MSYNQMENFQQSPITANGILHLLDEQSELSPIRLQVINVDEKAFGFVSKCQLADNLKTIEAIIKAIPQSNTRVKRLDIIEFKKEDVKKNHLQNSFYIVIQDFRICMSFTEKDIEVHNKSTKKFPLLSVQDRNINIQTLINQQQEVQVLSIQQIKSKGQAFNKVRFRWKLPVKVISKSDAKTSNRGTKWFDCLLQDQKKDKIDLVFFDNVDFYYSKIHYNQHYQIEKPNIFLDKFKNIYKLKAGLDTRIAPSGPQIPKSIELQDDTSVYNLLSVFPQKYTFNKIVFCLYVQTYKRQPMGNNKPISLYVCDCHNNIKKINCWNDHNLKIPESQSYIFLKGISHRGDIKSQLLHSTKDSKILSQKQAFEEYNVILNTFSPQDDIFYRRPYVNINLSTMDMIFQGESYYYVVAVLLFDFSQIKLRSKCHSCIRILDLGTGCSCNKPNVESYYNVRCRISDNTGSVPASIHSSLVEMVSRIDNKDSAKVMEEKVQRRMMSLNLKKELLKIQVKYKDQRSFVNVVDIYQRNLDDEIRLANKNRDKEI